MFQTLKLCLNEQRITSISPPPADTSFFYLIPNNGTASFYLRPGTEFRYIRP